MEIYKALLLMCIYNVTVKDYVYATGGYENESIHIHLIKNNGSWLDARNRCIEDHNGHLARENSRISCSFLANSTLPKENVSIWLSGYKIVSWIKSEGCYSINNDSKSVQSHSIQECLSSCQTQHIGFQINKCICVTTMVGIYRRANWNICNNGGTHDLPIYTVQNISLALSPTDENSCIGLYVNCSTAEHTLTKGNCSLTHTILCDKNASFDGIRTGSQQQAIENCSIHENGILLSNRSEICRRLAQFNNKNTAWTGIQMFLTDPIVNDEEIDENTTITNCSYLYCANDKNTAYFTKGNCHRNLQGFACEMKHKVINYITGTPSSHFVSTKSKLLVTSSQQRFTEESPDQTYHQESSLSFGLQTTNISTEKTSFEYKKTANAALSSTTANVKQFVTNEIIPPTNSGHMSSSYSKTNTLITITNTNQNKNLSSISNSRNDNIGTIIGVAVSMIIVAVAVPITVLFFRRRSQRNTESISLTRKNSRILRVISSNLNNKSTKQPSENYESPWDTNDNKINSIVLEHVVASLHNDFTNESFGTINSDSETVLNMYAVVNEIKNEIISQNEDIYIRDDVQEDDYNRLNHLFKPTDQNLSSDNIYDSALGARESSDDTYNSLNRGIINEDINDLYG